MSAHAEAGLGMRRKRRGGEDNEDDCRLRRTQEQRASNFSHDCMDVSRFPPNASCFDRLSKTSGFLDKSSQQCVNRDGTRSFKPFLKQSASIPSSSPLCGFFLLAQTAPPLLE
ncbi:hypothetical protein WN51_14309 [Melipona quadrifasciata]|uniref:Uncharacterized protein n=1 Tax=Melipona quadrifasciata TaxID=166423 RepID=A0A0N0BGR3_9HYME|nr:hypothetical protein WN51_14309 [Melipona quadrifasciata]